MERDDRGGKVSMTGAALSHDAAWELLPWHVNGTLADEERRGVDAHVLACPACRDELERCRATAVEVRRHAVAPSPHPAQLARLLRRLEPAEDEAAAVPVPPSRALAEPGGLLRRTPAAMRWVLLAQAAAIAGLLVAWGWRGEPVPSAYRTLSDRPAAAAAATPRVRVVFAPGATEAEIRELLLSFRGEIAGGPSPLGAYTIALPGGATAEPLPVVLAYLRQHPRVHFAEPVAGGG